MASQEAQTIATTVQLQFTLNHSARQACRHCGTALSTSSPEALKRHLAGCKSLPDSVRDVMDHAAVCESRAGLGCYGGVHASVYRGFRVTGWGVNECRRCGKVIRGWGAKLKLHSERGCRGVAVTWATVDVCGHFEKMDGRSAGDGSKCLHCGSVVHRSKQKHHLASCKSLPDSVRDVMDHAAVCESRAGVGRYGGVHAELYRGFRVTGWGVNECRRCGKVIRGWAGALKRHSERGCDGVAVTWATVDVCGQFEKMDGRGTGTDSKCLHCGSVVQRSRRKYHLGWCKSLPDSVRDVMDHAAVRESRAGMGCYGGVLASVFRGFRVTGWGVNECRRCGKVVRGWGARLKQHISTKGCVASGSPALPTSPPVAATSAPLTPGVTPPDKWELRRTRGRGPAHTSNGSGSAVKKPIPGQASCSTRPTKRRRPRYADIKNVYSVSDSQADGNWLRQTSVHHRDGDSSSSSSSSRTTVLRQPKQQAPEEVSGTGGSVTAVACSHARHSDSGATVGPCAVVNGGVAWAHGFTMTAGGLKVPLAPMPSRCKRARRARVSGDSTSVGYGGGFDCSVTMGSGSGAMVV